MAEIDGQQPQLLFGVAQLAGDDRRELPIRRSRDAAKHRIVSKLLGCAALQANLVQLCVCVRIEHSFGIGRADGHHVEFPAGEFCRVSAIRIGPKDMTLDFGFGTGREYDVPVWAGAGEPGTNGSEKITEFWRQCLD